MRLELASPGLLHFPDAELRWSGRGNTVVRVVRTCNVADLATTLARPSLRPLQKVSPLDIFSNRCIVEAVSRLTEAVNRDPESLQPKVGAKLKDKVRVN